jgi:hypothetical protein
MDLSLTPTGSLRPTPGKSKEKPSFSRRNGRKNRITKDFSTSGRPRRGTTKRLSKKKLRENSKGKRS